MLLQSGGNRKFQGWCRAGQVTFSFLSHRLLHQTFLQDDAGEAHNSERYGISGKTPFNSCQCSEGFGISTTLH